MLFGCSTVKHSYDGPKRDQSEIALIEGFHDAQIGRTEGLYIVGVDGEQFPHFNEYPYGVYLLPGQHEMTIHYWLGESGKGLSKHIGYVVDVEAGEKYLIKFKKKNNNIMIWIESEAGMLVGAKKEPTMQPEIHGWVMSKEQ